MGCLAYCGKQIYDHNMEVEENTNWVLMAYAHWRRTGIETVFREHRDVLRGFLDYLMASDTTGNGIPDQGVANTIDDASPAVQYGRDQIYLAVKTLAALDVGSEMLETAGDADVAAYRARADLIRQVIAEKGWCGDHFPVVLDRSAQGLIDPWSGQEMTGDVPGWDAAHIYTANGLALLDMVGRSVGSGRSAPQDRPPRRHPALPPLLRLPPFRIRATLPDRRSETRPRRHRQQPRLGRHERPQRHRRRLPRASTSWT